MPSGSFSERIQVRRERFKSRDVVRMWQQRPLNHMIKLAFLRSRPAPIASLVNAEEELKTSHAFEMKSRKS
jgi:hypothetical protein